MSVHRFRFQGFEAAQLSVQTASGGTVENFFPNFLDVNLNDDADLPDLQEYLALFGFEFVLSNPMFPPNNWCQGFSFSAPLILLAAATDVFCALSGASLGLLGVTGLAREMIPTTDGRIETLTLRSSIAITVDVFVEINAARTVIAAGVALAAGAVTPVTPSAFPAWTAGDVVRWGVQNTGLALSPDFTIGVGVRWG